jgi:hypothetical protein
MACFVVFCASWSCGGETEGSGGSTPAPTPIPLQNMPTELARVSCAKIYECCTQAERMQNPFLGSTEQDCAVTLAAFTTLIVPITQESITAGRVVYQGDVLASCLAQYSSLTCADAKSGAPSLEPTCSNFLLPQVAWGGTCEQDFECINGYCEQPSSSTPGQCQAMKPDGAGCSADSECTSDNCDFNGTCQPKPPPTATGSSFCGGM